jgi:hypothetical protein
VIAQAVLYPALFRLVWQELLEGEVGYVREWPGRRIPLNEGGRPNTFSREERGLELAGSGDGIVLRARPEEL